MINYKLIQDLDNPRIEEFECERMTEYRVFTKSKITGNDVWRERYSGGYVSYHESKQQAIDFFKKQIEDKITFHKESIEQLEQTLNKINQLL